MRVDVVVVSTPRYERGHEKDFVPPVTGMHLAALVGEAHDVRVYHQQVEPVPLDTDADLVLLTFFSGFAPAAYDLASQYRARGIRVVAGGPHVTFWPDEALRYVDSVVVGEAESVMAQMLADASARRLRPRYQGTPQPMDGLPTPRYDLLSPHYFIPRVVQATRGCPFSCAFCSVPSVNPGFRVRPVDEVLADIRYEAFDHWWQRKVVWFWDDNLTIRRPWVKALLTQMRPLRRWWLTQASLDIAKDPELLDLMEASGCIGVFFGIESFGAESLAEANKRQNRVETYQRAVAALHARGIAVMAGFIAGFDGDTPESIVAMADRLLEIGIDVPFLSVLTPFGGTPLFTRLQQEGRILPDRGWEHYNGYNVAFRPHAMPPDELLDAHRRLWRRAFSPSHVAARLAGTRRLRTGAKLLSAFMNGLYGVKQLRGNLPIDARLHAAPLSVGPLTAGDLLLQDPAPAVP